MKNKNIKLLIYRCLQEELIKKFKVGGIVHRRWVCYDLLGRQHHIPKSLRQPVFQEMVELKLLKENNKYGRYQFEICKPIFNLEDTSSIYREVGFF